MGKGVPVAVAGVGVVVLLAGGIGIGIGLGGGNGDGNGAGSGNPASISTSSSNKSVSSQENQYAEIRIEKNDIYFESELCENVDDLKQKIIDYGTTREYVFVYEKAIKATYDEVNEALSELESALGITINRE